MSDKELSGEQTPEWWEGAAQEHLRRAAAQMDAVPGLSPYHAVDGRRAYEQVARLLRARAERAEALAERRGVALREIADRDSMPWAEFDTKWGYKQLWDPPSASEIARQALSDVEHST